MAALVLLAANVSSGQRVQFPSAVPEGSPYTAPPPVTAPTYAPPPPSVGGPPAFDPYATSAPTLADPAAAPGQPTTFIGNATRFFQQVDFDSTWLAGNNQGTNLGITDVEASATFAIPIFFKAPFLVTPGFAAHFWNGPDTSGFGVNPGPEMPPETYDAYLDTTWKPQVTPRLSADLAVRVGMYTDFNFVSYQSLRTPFRALGLYAVNPQVTFVAGVVYLDRLSVRILPAGGVIWTPDPDSRFELLFPRPKLSHRIATIRNGNLWGYVEGEYGGNTWTIRRNQPGFSGDLVDYNDLRLSIGTELIGAAARRMNFEVGYVFNRRLMYQSGITPTTYPHGTVMVRGGFSF
ncbi:MAG TPA: hypothetical protein VGN12_17285 [Pirellulales bacterium]